MVTRAIKPKRDDTMLTDWHSTPERAPSIMLESTPTLMRFLFMVGLLLTLVGSLSLLAVEFNFNYKVTPGWGMYFLSFGLGLVLLHAFSEKDEQFRRAYAVAGIMILILSAMLGFLPVGGTAGGRFLSLGVPGLILGLILVGAVLRHETHEFWRAILSRVLILFTGCLLGFGFAVVNMHTHARFNDGVVMLVLALFFALTALVYQSDRFSFINGLILGGIGLVFIVEALVRCWLIGTQFLVPAGVTLITMGIIYIAVSLGVVCDWPVVVLTRRELSAYFYSPIAYPVLFGMMLIAMFSFLFFVLRLADDPRSPNFEPIVAGYILDFIPIFGILFAVPVVTMRLLSEEQKTGTMEVMLTAPVNETSIVIGKFLASLVFFCMTLLPLWLYLISLRVVGGQEFEFRPMLSFALAIICTGAGFVAMGLFCSSVTRNQIIAAVLCFAGMMLHMGLFWIKRTFPEMRDFFTYISFIDLWILAIQGMVAPGFLFFHLSLAVFFLFVTIKVLEARRWK